MVWRAGKMPSAVSEIAWRRGFEALTSGSVTDEELEVDELSIEMILFYFI